MASNLTKLDGKDGALLDLLPEPRLLPGEDPETYDALRHALLLELAPGTAYETMLAEALVQIEWEAHRYRRLRDDLLRARFREFALGALSYGEIGPADDPDQEDEEIADALLGNDPEARTAAIAELSEHGFEEGIILAEAYVAEQRALEPIERHIVEIEPRRRRQREDFDRVKALRLSSTVPDAEVISADDD